MNSQKVGKIHPLKRRQKYSFDVSTYQNDLVHIKKINEIPFRRIKEQFSSAKKPFKQNIYHDIQWEQQECFADLKSKTQNKDFRSILKHNKYCLNQTFYHSKSKTQQLSLILNNLAQKNFSKLNISKIKHLESLYINIFYQTQELEAKAGDSGIQYLVNRVQRFNQLQQFDITLKKGREKISNNSIEKIIEVLNHFKLLFVLKLEFKNFQECQEQNLKKLQQVAKNLPKLIQFKYFLISWQQQPLTNKAMKYLGRIFEFCIKLREVQLDLQQFDQEGLDEVVKSLKNCKQMEELTLKLGSLNNQRELNLQSLITSLQYLSLLTKLRLNTEISSEQFCILLFILPINIGLKELSLECLEGQYSEFAISQFSKLKNLITIELKAIGDKQLGVVSKLLTESLKETKNLLNLTLTFSNCDIKQDTFQDILKNIASFKILHYLYIDFGSHCTSVNDAIIQDFMTTILSLKQLSCLVLKQYSQSTIWTSNVMKSISEGLDKFQKLKHFYFQFYRGQNTFNISDFQGLAEALSRCDSIIYFSILINHCQVTYSQIEKYFRSLKVEYSIYLE